MITHATCLFEQLRGIKRRSIRVEPHLQSATIQASGGAEPLSPTRILYSQLEAVAVCTQKLNAASGLMFS